MAESTRELADARRRGAVAEAAAPRRSFDIARSKLMDGVAYLHDIFFEAIYKRMSYDGGEYLRYSLFPEVAKEMSKKSRRMVESTCAGACSPTCRRTCLSTAASTSVTRGPSSRRAPAAWCRARRSTSRARPRTSWSARGLTASGGQPQTALASRLCRVIGSRPRRPGATATHLWDAGWGPIPHALLSGKSGGRLQGDWWCMLGVMAQAVMTQP